MKQFSILTALFLMFSILFITCKKEDNIPKAQETISSDVLNKIKSRGFGTGHVQKVKDGYIVEGDIFLSENDLNRTITSPAVRIAEVEQYRTENTVRGLPRTITVFVSTNTGLSNVYTTATDAAITRYNALDLQLTFQRVNTSAMINIEGMNIAANADGSITLGMAGFPTDAGEPFNLVQLNINPGAFGTNPEVNYLTSVIAHEIGHCIGFRHTDYFNRKISCGGYFDINEGLYNNGVYIGAIHIPGTPTGSDANSWMLACNNDGANRPFTTNDRIALSALYPPPPPPQFTLNIVNSTSADNFYFALLGPGINRTFYVTTDNTPDNPYTLTLNAGSYDITANPTTHVSPSYDFQVYGCGSSSYLYFSGTRIQRTVDFSCGNDCMITIE